MRSILFLILLSLSSSFATRRGITNDHSDAEAACRALEYQLPGLVNRPGSEDYAEDISHFILTASQNATCSIAPSSIKEIQTAIRIIGRKDIRSPFAVKGGGHNFNRGFSSTSGVQIALSKFRNISYNEATRTATLGAGLTWDVVYTELQSRYNVTVVGGRIAGVGLGLALVGGYSWITEQHGLAIDNIVSVDLILPNGTFTRANENTNSDILFGLKGGLNNFGIVTSYTLNAFPIGNVWAGSVVYPGNQSEAVVKALSDFSFNNTDPKAQIFTSYVVTTENGFQGSWQAFLLYDGDQPAVFQPFMDIPSISWDVKDRPFYDFVASTKAPIGSRSVQTDLPIVKYPVSMINKMIAEITKALQQAISEGRSAIYTAILVEPFFNAFSRSTDSAWPHSASRLVTPGNVAVGFSDSSDYDFFHGWLGRLANVMQGIAVREGQSAWNDIHYIGYALDSVPLELLYGRNLPRLRKVKARVDPTNIMGLAGGFKF